VDIFIETREFETVEKMISHMRYLYMTDKSCKVEFDEIRTIMQQRMNEESRSSVCPGVKEQDNSPSGINHSSSKSGREDRREEEPQRTRGTKTKQQQRKTNKRKQTKGRPHAEKKTSRPGESSQTRKQNTTTEEKEVETNTTQKTLAESLSSTTAKPKQIQWYQWENSKLGVGIGGFNRESAVVKGERVFRVGKSPRAARVPSISGFVS